MANLDCNITDGHITAEVDIELSPEQQELINAEIVKYLSKLKVCVAETPQHSYPEDCASYDGHFFKLFTQPLYWFEAKAACEAMGGHLATSTSAEKNAFLANIAGSTRVWLGGTDYGTEGTWKWITGEAWSYTNWRSGEPNNTGGKEHWLGFNIGEVGVWSDEEYNVPFYYICEWDDDPCLTINPKDIPHEKLAELLGGDENGHHHLTNAELERLRQLIELLFPDGAEEPRIPIGELYPIGGGVAPTTLPDWTKIALPATYSAYDNSGNMYYGRATLYKKPYEDNLLIVPLIQTGNSQTVYPMYTTDLLTWKRYETVSVPSYGQKFTHCFFADWNKTTTAKRGYKISYLMFNTNTVKKLFRRISGGTCAAYSTSGAISIAAGCYSPKLRRVILVSEHGEISRLYDKSVKSTTVSVTKLSEKILPHCGLTAVNPGCAIWIPDAQVFCVAGKDSVSVSETSDAGSWIVNPDAPKDLRGMTFRDDIEYQGQAGCVFAWSGEDKLFYKSRDGRNWERHNASPIPLAEVKSVAYSPEFGMYCAVGSPENNSNYAYLSKDLMSWSKSKVASSPLTAESVVWMNSTKKFVLLPNSGTYCYVFDPANWAG